MKKAGISGGETLRVGGKSRVANWDDDVGDPDVDKIDLAAATKTLKTALANLPTANSPAVHAALAALHPPPKMSLALEEQEDHGFALRPHLAHDGKITGLVEAERAAQPGPLKALELDALTTVDDPTYIPALMEQLNLPKALKDALKTLL